MNTASYILLIGIIIWIVYSIKRTAKKGSCCGKCSSCCGCNKSKRRSKK